MNLEIEKHQSTIAIVLINFLVHNWMLIKILKHFLLQPTKTLAGQKTDKLRLLLEAIFSSIGACSCYIKMIIYMWKGW